MATNEPCDFCKSSLTMTIYCLCQGWTVCKKCHLEICRLGGNCDDLHEMEKYESAVYQAFNQTNFDHILLDTNKR